MTLTLSFTEISLLLASYIVIADAEIDMNEIEELKKYNLSNNYIEEQSKILSDDEGKISLDELISLTSKFNAEEQEKLFQLMFKVVYADNFLHSKEFNLVKTIASKLNFPDEKLLQIQKNEEANSDKLYLEKSKSILDSIYSIGYKITKSEFFEKKLLNGQDFVEKIKSISEFAKMDLEIATKRMEQVNQDLMEKSSLLESQTSHIINNKRGDEDSQKLESFAIELNTKFKKIISDNLKTNQEVLNKKKRTIDYFTIAFMGRTKAGKSTFHKVVTGEDTDDIGVGKLRTTRYNRSFNWENLRIIDTPGIGAPGGMSDTETAKTIIDEADLVCYVVTNDSIQETEFDFLKSLKEKNKPLFIILNIKENIEHPIRFKRFLENPLKWKEETGEKSIQGHFDRINELIKKDYDVNSIEIIPVHLLAALLSEDKSKNYTNNEIKLLLKGSNIEEYNDKVKQTIFRTGHLKKTQNIIDGCNFQVNTILTETENSLSELVAIQSSLQKNRDELNLFIKNEKEKVKVSIRQTIENSFDSIKNSIPYFASSNYEFSGNDLNQKWKEHVKNYYSTLDKEIKVIFNEFEQNLNEKIEEAQDDIKMEMNFIAANANVSKTDITNYKSWVNIAGLSIMFAFGGIGIVGGLIVTSIISLFSNFFESKEAKIEKAKAKIIEEISETIKKDKISYDKNLEETFEKSIVKIQKELNDNFNSLISSSKAIIEVLKGIKEVNYKITNEFNNVLYYRILQHFNILSDKLSLETLPQFINKNKIKRDFQTSLMQIESTYDIPNSKIEEIEKLLQTKIDYKKI